MWKWGLPVIAVLIVTAFFVLGREMYLVPSEPVRLVANLHDRNTTDPTKTIAVLVTGLPVSIIECRNLVDDQVYRVQTMTGVEGYVVEGRFKIESKSSLNLLGSNRVICH